jgi:endonuclease YncB( thermonuclease family)
MREKARNRHGSPSRVTCAFVAAALAAGRLALAEPVEWEVVAVHDGDTLTAIDADKVQHKVRLDGIDAPETRQPFGTKSRDRLAEITKGNPVTVQAGKRDKYGRTVARIEVDSQDVNRQMVAEGLAWHYTPYSDDATFADAEGEARAAGRGLWADREPVPPWEWRATGKGQKRIK